MAEWWQEEFEALLGQYEWAAEGDPRSVNELLFGGELDVDLRAQELFVEAMFNDNEEAYVALVDYMWDVHGIDFEDVFSWEDFRAWYKGSNQ